jgi:pimeloyl-ACP methyl ester carboxylesterase
MLVHGAWHGPWCWRDFGARLAAAGHDVHTVTLRGHDREPAGDRGRARLWHRIRDYVDDLREAVSRLDALPVVVGHSMGGLVVQKYLERHPAAAAVLMAAVPPRGATAATVRFAGRHPLVFARTNATLRLGPIVGTPRLAREMLFTPATPPEVLDRCFPRLQDESYPAYLDMMLFALPRPERVRVPMLVLGGELDRVFSVAEVRATGRAYRTEAHVFAGMGHDLMLDQGWPQVADRLAAWVDQTTVDQPTP